jgi:putative nucleotidyltransferase with HDIG domain
MLKYIQRQRVLGWLENPAPFRYVFGVLLIVSILVEVAVAEPLRYILLYTPTLFAGGIAFWNKPLWFRFIVSTSTISYHQFNHWRMNDGLLPMFLDALISFLIIFSSSSQMKSYIQTKRNMTDLILALSKSIDSRDPYTGFHSENVARYALKIAEDMKLPAKMRESIYIGGLLHDIGKIGVPESVLTKPSKLSEGEYASIQKHPVIGYEMLKHIPSFKESGILDMVLHHHEKYDGTGYPQRLHREEIPLTARILAIADSFDAMTSKRIYRENAMIWEHAAYEIRRNKGSQFDPRIADVFLSILEREGPQLIARVKALRSS